MKDIKEFKNKYGLSGLHSQPTGYMNFEDKTEEVFKDVELLINKTREETIREVGDIVNKIIIKDYSKKWSDNVVDFAQDIVNRTTSLIKKELNKLKK